MSEYLIDRYEAFRERFGAAGVVLGVIAIVLAVGGSALAASGLNGKQKKEVKAIAKSFQGTGPAGAAGINGTNGKDGTNGTSGTAGTNGAPGKSVVTATLNPGQGTPPCEEGGVTVEVEGSGTKKQVCNGEEGPPGTNGTNGTNGSPWTAGGTLPSGSTMTGAYAAPGEDANGGGPGTPSGLGQGMMDDGAKAYVTLSFFLPVTPAPNVVFVPGDLVANDFGANPGAGCPGLTAQEVPQAASGKLCIYGEAYDPGGTPIPSATPTITSPTRQLGELDTRTTSPTGTLLKLVCSSPATGVCWGKGVWAVTG